MAWTLFYPLDHSSYKNVRLFGGHKVNLYPIIQVFKCFYQV
jgi:hypothetical protein